jgi:signal transduction histidine kinase
VIPAGGSSLSLERIVILAPVGRDAVLIESALQAEEATPAIVPGISELCEQLAGGRAAVLIIAEESLSADGLTRLRDLLAKQEPWSDVPILLLTSSGETTLSTLRIMKSFAPSGNLTLLERPFRRITLQSAVQVALRSRRRQHEMHALYEKEKAATRLRDEFISIASHELKTPLTSLKLQTQISQRLIARGDVSAYEPAKTQKLIETTGRQLERLSRLVEDMLDISRINTGKLHLEISRFDLCELVRETLERIQPQIDNSGCTVEAEACEPVEGDWDRYRIEQVLNNLLSNAIRYCPGKPIRVSVRTEERQAMLMVRDEGAGIAPENHERIFSRFERAVSASNISGLGLGLYICRNIIEAHGGRIHVESELGRGSSFIVALPLPQLDTSAASATI